MVEGVEVDALGLQGPRDLVVEVDAGARGDAAVGEAVVDRLAPAPMEGRQVEVVGGRVAWVKPVGWLGGWVRGFAMARWGRCTGSSGRSRCRWGWIRRSWRAPFDLWACQACGLVGCRGAAEQGLKSEVTSVGLVVIYHHIGEKLCGQ